MAAVDLSLSEMPGAVTCIVNPGPSSTPDDDETLLFYLTKSKQLALEYRPFPAMQESADFGSNDDQEQKIPAWPGNLVAVWRKNLPSVYALTYPSPSSTHPNEPGNLPPLLISQLSPVYNPISKTITTGYYGLAASSDLVKRTYLYYLKKPSETDPIQIMEVDVSGNNAADPVPVDSSVKPLKNSKLAARIDLDTDQRIVYYQHDNGGGQSIIKGIPCSDNNPNTFKVPDSEYAKPGTSIAVITVGTGEAKMLYMYFVDINDVLWRARCNGNKTADWENAHKVPNPPQIKQSTTFTVSTDGKYNYLWYQSATKDNYQKWVDKKL